MQKIMGVVNHVAFSTLSRLQDDPQRLREGLLRACNLATVVSVPLLWGLSSCAPEFVRLVLGEKWLEAILPLQLISLVVPLRMVSGLMATAVMAVGKADVYLRTMVVGICIFPASFLVGAQGGLNGLALAWPFAWLLNFSINFRRVAGVLDLGLAPVADAMRVPVLAGIPMIAMVLLTRAVTDPLSDLQRLPLLVTVAGATYAAFVYALQPAIVQELRRVASAARG